MYYPLSFDIEQDLFLPVVFRASFPPLVQLLYSCPLVGHLDHPDSKRRRHNGRADLLPGAGVSAQDTVLQQRWPGVGWEDRAGPDPGRPSPRMRHGNNISKERKYQFRSISGNRTSPQVSGYLGT